MAVDDELYILKLLGVPASTSIEAQDLRQEYVQFSHQLELLPGTDIVLSDPYFILVETAGSSVSLKDWIQNLTAKVKNRLLLLSIFCRPFDPTKVWEDDRSRFIDDPTIRALFVGFTVSLSEGTSGVPFGIDVLGECRRALNDPGMKQLMDVVSPNSSIETFTSEFIGGQPGNYAYQAWQVANWSNEWAVVYGISDAAHDEGYPFPRLLGFCRQNHFERNFVILLREAASRFDEGFYYTFGTVWGSGA